MDRNLIVTTILFSFLLCGCEILDQDSGIYDPTSGQKVYLEDVARLFSGLPLTSGQMQEVRDAVSSSSGNGYDEEYTMKDLFEVPGKGVGDPETKAPRSYIMPLRDMLRQHVISAAAGGTDAVKGGTDAVKGESSEGNSSAALRFDEDYLDALMESGLQIYWPYSENWDGETLPVITFDPETDAPSNIGYEISPSSKAYTVKEVEVDEKMAESRPVWVINRNSDARYKTAEVIRREHPEWEEGGSIIIRPSEGGRTGMPEARKGKPGIRSDGELSSRSLVMRDFTMLRQYDNWFSGASEFFVKIGAVEDFTATTEAELKLYSPFVTDMMVVVKRKDIGVPIPLNTVMVADYSEQMTQCAFMVNEDDGGTRKSWKCKAFVRIQSKSYGIELDIPLNEWDDIVWRGQLDQAYLVKHNNVPGRFGDVRITFGVEEL